jgi:hypothetical protein
MIVRTKFLHHKYTRIQAYDNHNRDLLLHCNMVVPCIGNPVTNPSLQEQEQTPSFGSPSVEHTAGIGEVRQSVSLESSEHSK